MGRMEIEAFEGLDAIYSEERGISSFTLVPSGMAERVLPEKIYRTYIPIFKHIVPECMVQAALTGDRLSRDFTAGLSLRNTETSLGLRSTGRSVESTGGKKRVVTTFEDGRGLRARHIVEQVAGHEALTCRCELTNAGGTAVTAEMLASFSLSGLSPFSAENNTERILLHRLRSNWSGEGRLDSRPVAAFEMEDSWTSLGARYVRFGQVGSMPARGFLPFAALEDLDAGVTWAVMLEAPGSWQIETGNLNGALVLSGGLADYNFGHWRKTLAPGETLTTHEAVLTVCRGGLLEACDRLTDYMNTRLDVPACEEALPVIYNEYMFTNGSPTLCKLLPQMDACRALGVGYFVMDDGWSHLETQPFNGLGDWRVNRKRFPDGLAPFAAAARERGLVPGIWFEFESAGEDSEVYQNDGMLLRLDGHIVNHMGRGFLDFRKPEVRAFLRERVIGQLRDSEIGYLKVDYNENIGLGCDGAESVGEGLRSQLEAVTDFYRELKEELPGLVVEICSSGGMRHEPLFVSLGSMCSFSDLHEVPEGALVAVGLHRFLLPRQMQVWSSMRTDYDASKIRYTLVKGMLGRLCLSGDLAGLGEERTEIVREALRFYDKLRPLIRSGRTVRIDDAGAVSLRRFCGTFSLARETRDGRTLAFYAFALHAPEVRKIAFEAPAGYEISDGFGGGRAYMEGRRVVVETDGSDWFARAVLLNRREQEEIG